MRRVLLLLVGLLGLAGIAVASSGGMLALYVGFGFGVAAVILLLYEIERMIGPTTRFREPLNPIFSPGLALAGLVASVPVVVELTLVTWIVRGVGAEPPTAVWYGSLGLTLIVVAYFEARWWQPLYLGAITWAFFTVNALFDPYAVLTGGALLDALGVGLFVAGFVCVGVALKLAHARVARPHAKLSASSTSA